MFALAGSRSLSSEHARAVFSACSRLVVRGPLLVGCCAGVDSFVLQWAVSSGNVSAVSCFAAFGPGGVGAAGAVSGVQAVSAFAAAGGAVRWWSGGGPSVPVRARLAARTRAVVSAAASGTVVFFASPVSRGSLLAASFAASLEHRVTAYPCGFPGSTLPLLAAGGVWEQGFAAWHWCGPVGLFQQ